jgi:hypothetical protein
VRGEGRGWAERGVGKGRGGVLKEERNDVGGKRSSLIGDSVPMDGLHRKKWLAYPCSSCGLRVRGLELGYGRFLGWEARG